MNPNPEAMHKRLVRLWRQLAQPRLVLQGTITPRSIVRPEPQNPDQQKIYGPYYQWTWKRGGKTVTVNLTKTQARAYQNGCSPYEVTSLCCATFLRSAS